MKTNDMLRYTPFVATFGRILIAVLFLISGLFKIAAPAMTIGYINSAHLPLPTLAYIIAIAVEVVGGVLLVVGFQTRIVALVMAVYCVAAGLFFHSNFGDQNEMVHFLKNISMAGGLLQVLVFGAGSLSIDGRRAASGVNISAQVAT